MENYKVFYNDASPSDEFKYLDEIFVFDLI